MASSIFFNAIAVFGLFFFANSTACCAFHMDGSSFGVLSPLDAVVTSTQIKMRQKSIGH